MVDKKMLGVQIKPFSKKEVLEQIKKCISTRKEFCQIISLNPENIVAAREDREFKEAVRTAQIHIVDGVGVALAAKFLGIKAGERIAGVDLMDELIRLAYEDSLSVVLIGGKGNLAEELAECYRQRYHQIQIKGFEAIKNIKNPSKEEEEAIFSIVTAMKPSFVFAAFGSPAQEKWFYRNRVSLQGVVCMGVGGAFNYLSGRVSRPSRIVRALGLEWLYRLVTQPWRWKRQLRLVKFMYLVLKQRLVSR